MNTQPFNLFQQQLLIAEIEQTQQPLSENSSIDYGAQHLVDMGVVVIVFTAIVIIGMLILS